MTTPVELQEQWARIVDEVRDARYAYAWATGASPNPRGAEGILRAHGWTLAQVEAYLQEIARGERVVPKSPASLKGASGKRGFLAKDSAGDNDDLIHDWRFLRPSRSLEPATDEQRRHWCQEIIAKLNSGAWSDSVGPRRRDTDEHEDDMPEWLT